MAESWPVVTYLLNQESANHFQEEVEQTYHIFYLLMELAVTNMKKKCLLSGDTYDYHLLACAKLRCPLSMTTRT